MHMEADIFPQYVRIALDVAAKIESGDLAEHQKISGRSLLASEYGVSPETIRKASRILANAQVVEVIDKSGVRVLSRSNAKLFLTRFRNRQDELELYAHFRNLYEQCNDLNRQMMEVGAKIVESRARPLTSEWAIPHYRLCVPDLCDKIGQSLSDLRFWEQTGATVIAILRGTETILSPGPDAQLHAQDTIVFVGEPESVTAVEQFINL